MLIAFNDKAAATAGIFRSAVKYSGNPWPVSLSAVAVAAAPAQEVRRRADLFPPFKTS